MKTNHAVIDATGVYIGVNFAQHYGKRVRVLEVERFDEAEREIGPFTLPALVIRDECTLKRFGGFAATDRLAVGLLNADGQWTNGVRYRVPARDVDLTQLPANWEEMYRHIAHQHLSAGMVDTTGLAAALGAAYLAGARALSRGLV